MLLRLIAPKWLEGVPKVLEDDFTEEEWQLKNELGYNIYFLPNGPSTYQRGTTISGSHVDTFNFVFVDFDLKSGSYDSKSSFIEALKAAPEPSSVVDSGNGIHVYWAVSDLDAISYLRLSRRLMRLLKTDEAVGQIFQLMRLPGSVNTKDSENPKLCEIIQSTDKVYSCEELDKALPSITLADEEYCQRHYDRTYNVNNENIKVQDKLPPKFFKLIQESDEAKAIWSGKTEDRSKSDFRLGHLMMASGFTKDEAMSVLVNSPKALSRAPVHRVGYAENIVDKIWVFEEAEDKASLNLSNSVLEILQRPNVSLKGTRLPCYKYIDNTELGFRLGHVMGLVAGSGVGKTAMALNIFMGFVESNPDYEHFFCPLEQPDREIAARWQTMCGDNTALHSKVHVLSNYDANGAFRDLSLDDIKKHILDFKKTTGKAIGCVVIDHIGVLCNNNRLGQDEGVKQIAKAMKGFATETNTFLIMQSQTSREKAGIGDLELNKDAAFGTSVFENFCDYLVTLWQPLKRAYSLGAPTIMSYKFCKIRHKKQGVDKLEEDVPYSVYFDPALERIRELTEAEEKGLDYWVNRATNLRKEDRKSGIVKYKSVRWETKESNVGNADNNQNSSGATGPTK